MKQLLVISNNVLSRTNNNGKTIYSFIDGLEDVFVNQLFFSGEVPRIEGFSYYRISDKDILSGIFDKKKRGKIVNPDEERNINDDYSIKNAVGRNEFTLIAREMLWHRKWLSPSLLEWLDNIKPEIILFVAGDAIFAYDICIFIQERYHSRLTVYVTDDYVVPRKHESFLHSGRRNIIKRKLSSVLKISKCFYTISQSMQKEYKALFGKDSFLAVNMSSDLKDANMSRNNDEIILIYAGSFYFGRAEVLHRLGLAIRSYNDKHETKAKLMMYSNSEPSNEIKRIICVSEASEYGGSLNCEQLKLHLNMADILVFVESFENDQIEKVKYSLSTKVPEYMSVGKPILALGPCCIGSMEYLSDVAICVNNPETILDNLIILLDSKEKQIEYGRKSREKYLKNHNIDELKKDFIRNVIG